MKGISAFITLVIIVGYYLYSNGYMTYLSNTGELLSYIKKETPVITSLGQKLLIGTSTSTATTTKSHSVKATSTKAK